MSIEAITWAFKYPLTCSGEKFVLVVLANYADENHQCYPSQKHIATVTALGTRTVIRYLKSLEKAGLVSTLERRTKAGQFFSNIYRLHLDHVPERQTVKQPSANDGKPPSANDDIIHVPERHTILKKEDTKEEDTKDIIGGAVDCREVFGYWLDKTGRTGTVFNTGFQKLLRTLFAEGYTVEQMQLAIDGNKNHPHFTGDNDTGTVYDDFDLIFRSAKKVEQFIGYARAPQRKDTRGPGAQSTTEAPRTPLTTDQAKGHALAYKLHLDIDEHNAAREAALDDKIKNAWVDVLGDMEAVLNRDAFNTWFKPLRLIDVQATSPVILAGSITCDWVRTYYRDAFGRALADHGFGVIVWQDSEYASAEDFKAHFPDDHWQEIEKHL